VTHSIHVGAIEARPRGVLGETDLLKYPVAAGHTSRLPSAHRHRSNLKCDFYCASLAAAVLL